MPREELIEMEREIDRLKKQDDPSFQGAFHEKKKIFRPKAKPKSKVTPKNAPKNRGKR